MRYQLYYTYTGYPMYGSNSLLKPTPIVYQLKLTLIPSGLFANPRYNVFEDASHDVFASVISCPLLSVTLVTLGLAGSKTRILFNVLIGLFATNE